MTAHELISKIPADVREKCMEYDADLFISAAEGVVSRISSTGWLAISEQEGVEMLTYACRRYLADNRKHKPVVIPATLDEALDMGYRLADMQYARGYVSRRIERGSEPVRVAGGRRSGELYIDEPCYTSTRYHIRHYLIRLD